MNWKRALICMLIYLIISILIGSLKSLRANDEELTCKSSGPGLLTEKVIADVMEGDGSPVVLEGSIMVADAMTAPFATNPGPGRVLEMNVMTGEIGIIFKNPLPELGLNDPWRPTGVLSGGVNGHVFISAAARHTISEFHRDGTLIRTVRPITAPDLTADVGAAPHLLGLQFMPNGNIIVAVCDATFNDPSVFPPISTTPEQAANSRLLVLDPETLQVIDEYNAPDDERWTCMAGIIFSEEGMYVSMVHGAAVFVIDWKEGTKNAKNPGNFTLNHLNKPENQAKVIRVIDLLEDNDPTTPPPAMDDPRRRDSLRAITFDSNGNLYATNRARAKEINPGPDDMRQHVAVVPNGFAGPNGTLAMDHGVQVIAGIRINRISGPGCAHVRQDPDNIYPDSFNDCDCETLYVGASGTGNVMEYLIHPDFLDGPECRNNNVGCAQPIATFFGAANDMDNIDPRMLVVVHEAFVQ